MLAASTLSVDASELTPEENIQTILWLANYALTHKAEVTFEMEDAVDDDYTSIDTARHLIGRVEEQSPGSVWLWAPALGTQHGLTQGKRAFDPALARKHVEAVKSLTGRDVGLALHGTSGLDESQLTQAVAAGVVKVNWSSELLYLRSQAAAKYFREIVSQVEPGKGDWKKTVMDAGLQKFIAQACLPAISRRIRLLGGGARGGAFLQFAGLADF
jgi:fructose-bisphosphate aldolase class II